MIPQTGTSSVEVERSPETVPTLPPVAGSYTPEDQQPKMLGCQQWTGEPETGSKATMN